MSASWKQRLICCHAVFFVTLTYSNDALASKVSNQDSMEPGLLLGLGIGLLVLPAIRRLIRTLNKKS